MTRFPSCVQIAIMDNRAVTLHDRECGFPGHPRERYVVFAALFEGFEPHPKHIGRIEPCMIPGSEAFLHVRTNDRREAIAAFALGEDWVRNE